MPPLRELGLRLFQRREPLDVEAFVAESAVEALDEPVLHRPSRTDEAELYTGLDGPGFHRAAGELTAIIQSDAVRSCNSFGHCSRKRRDHFGSVHGAIRFEPNTFARKLIDHGEDANVPTVRQFVAHEVC